MNAASTLMRGWATATLAAVTLITATGCATDDPEPDPAPNPDVQTVEVAFSATVGADAFACGQTYTGLGASNSDLTLNDARIYVHDVRLVDAAGNEIPLTVEDDGKWQQGGVVLLDFEDGTSGCADTGNADVNTIVRGTVPAETDVSGFNGVRFVLGVPFDLNHANAATAAAPLNLTAMWWNWNSGYKYVRVEGASTGLDSWRFHLGATMCDGDMAGNVTSCANPNRAEVALEGFDPTTRPVVFDLAEMLAGVDLETNTMDTPPGCMAGPSDPDCAPYFENLGLPFDGASAGAQRAFRAAN
ncbi:MAG: MbnP family copper-binding protein [Myxococcota bacterium]